MSFTTTEQAAVVTLSEAAATRLRGIMEEKNLIGTHALRVFVSGGGCGGMQYGMTFDNAPGDIDIVFEQHGLRMIVDQRSVEYITGANIDYVENLMGGGFQIENPNALSTCGCGQSFRTRNDSGADAEAEGDACGCGGCH